MGASAGIPGKGNHDRAGVRADALVTDSRRLGTVTALFMRASRHMRDGLSPLSDDFGAFSVFFSNEFLTWKKPK
jgi:hypothetical protein